MATNPLELSDEDFLKQPAPEGAAAEGDQAQQQQQEEKPAEKPDAGAQTQEDEGLTDAEKAAAAADPDEDEQDNKDDKSGEGEKKPDNQQEQKPADKDPKDEGKEPEQKAAKDEAKPGEEKPGEKAEASPSGSEPPNYEEFYGKIMAPITANGKKIELKNADEVVALIQMGANYTRKMQALAPARKVMTMLENQGLLDESKLNFLISLDKGDPEAIKKLLIDKGVDPLDIDTKVEPAYREGNYSVTDSEVSFRSTMDDLMTSEPGRAVIIDINEQWDPTSKEMLWQNPEVATTIRDQKEAGIYDRITTEMDRRKTLGQLSQSIPFLKAYETIGNELHEKGAFKDLTPAKEPKQDDKPAPKVIGTSEGKPKQDAKNGDQAGAAAPSRTVPGKAREAANFLAMSDDDFLKSEKFQGRL